MEAVFHPQDLVIIGILISLEVALSVDNLVGLREKLQRLPEKMRRPMAAMASVSGLCVRLALVLILIQLSKLLDPFCTGTLFASGRGLLLSLGGAFLIIKALSDLKQHLNKEDNPGLSRLTNQMPSLGEIIIYDALLSIDSVVAALALANNLELVFVAMLIAHVLLNVFWKQIDGFFLNRPSMMTITLCFLLVLGLVSMIRILGLVLAEETLIVALGFALMVELLNGKALRQPARIARERLPQQKIQMITENSFISAHENSSIKPAEEAAVAINNLFAPETCASCHSTTFSAIPFCMSCGTNNVAEPVCENALRVKPKG